MGSGGGHDGGGARPGPPKETTTELSASTRITRREDSAVYAAASGEGAAATSGEDHYSAAGQLVEGTGDPAPAALVGKTTAISGTKMMFSWRILLGKISLGKYRREGPPALLPHSGRHPILISFARKKTLYSLSSPPTEKDDSTEREEQQFLPKNLHTLVGTPPLDHNIENRIAAIKPRPVFTRTTRMAPTQQRTPADTFTRTETTPSQQRTPADTSYKTKTIRLDPYRWRADQ